MKKTNVLLAVFFAALAIALILVTFLTAAHLIIFVAFVSALFALLLFARLNPKNTTK